MLQMRRSRGNEEATQERRYVGWKIPSKYFLPASAVRHGPLSFDVKRSARRVREKLRETQTKHFAALSRIDLREQIRFHVAARRMISLN
ncbi:unnamed protein product [Lasius platythorax]|uniref:Uncharacterized protein n=1 Tax=Lasius platythorax TaxID=488582 RepID=A0AAV2NCX7_9HYME